MISYEGSGGARMPDRRRRSGCFLEISKVHEIGHFETSAVNKKLMPAKMNWMYDSVQYGLLQGHNYVVQ